jgi:peroxidase
VREQFRGKIAVAGDSRNFRAINIERGHDLGLGTLNETRAALGLAPYTTFEQLTTDPGTLAGLKATFTSIDQVDLWTGGLSEHHMPGAMIGETFGLIIAHQFEALRDGDQFYYEKALDPAELAMVENTSLSDIIERDTDTDVMQADAFLTADRHASDVKAADPNALQLIIGTTARDNIQGGEADDTLVVSGNVQNVAGGGGNDTFVFDFSQSTTTVVRDFHVGSDLLEIHGVNPTVDFSAVHVSSNPTMTLVDIGQDHIKLLGVDHVSASDFLFHV